MKRKYDIVSITSKFAERIKDIMFHSGVTEKMVAEGTGVNRRTLRRIFNFEKKNFNVYIIDKVCFYFKLQYQELVGIGEIIDKYGGDIMGLEILDAVYNILDKNEGHWQEGADFLLYRLDGLDLAIPKDIIEDWLDNFMSGAMKAIGDIKERKEEK